MRIMQTMLKTVNNPEILAPAGNLESLTAAVRCGADAVYLGGATLNARRGAQNFDEIQLKEAVSYCHARNTKVYLTLNTIVFDSEIAEAEAAIKIACAAGVDAFIIQDLAVARMAKECAPSIAMHASTQMSVHNLEGVLALEKLGFTRVVLARELSQKEILYIAQNSSAEIECFVHGALCMSVSGSCYLSCAIGGRSGNRGMCAQPCRLPFKSDNSEYALSLKDLSLIQKIQSLAACGVTSFKIEGRLKRPEYVAAATTACKQALSGEDADIKALEAVFSRSGFTDGYFSAMLGGNMFGTRRHEDVTSAGGVLKSLQNLYKQESPLVNVDFSLAAKTGANISLTVSDGTNEVTVLGDIPQKAINVSTTTERALAALKKSGGTPFKINNVSFDIDDELMIPASQLNALRREALDSLLKIRSAVHPHDFFPFKFNKMSSVKNNGGTKLRARIQSMAQYSPFLYESCDKIIVPIGELNAITAKAGTDKSKFILEIPQICFDTAELAALLNKAKYAGFTQVYAGNMYAFELVKELGFTVHAAYSLNCTNSVSAAEYQSLGAQSLEFSFECSAARVNKLCLNAEIPSGFIAYGYLPLMVTRNRPAGLKNDNAFLSDRLGKRFAVRRNGDVYTLYNCVPLWTADEMDSFFNASFATLYFTDESADTCINIVKAYKSKESAVAEFTRGLYFREVK